MPRKTVEVDKLREFSNGFLAGAGDRTVRKGIISLLEFALHQSGNYNGFTYLSDREVAVGKPGVNVQENGCIVEDYDARFEDTDDTRRKYF